jgi:F0F1-type ATP synthase assembly protein I
MGKRDDEKIDLMNASALLLQFGLTVAIPIISGIIIGKFIDATVGTNHVFMFMFLAIGILVACYAAYREIKRFISKKKQI